MAFSSVITYDTASMVSFDTSLVQVTGGHLQLKLSGTYPVSNPVISTQHQLPVTSLTSFSESKTAAGSDAVQYQAVINGSAFWYNSTAPAGWQTSDGTYTQSNTATVVNAHLSTLVSDLLLTTPLFFRLNVLLHSASGATTPTLTSNTVAYTFASSSASAITQTTIYCYLSDLLAQVPTYDATKPYQFYVKNDRAFFHGNNFVVPFTKSATFNSSGYASLVCMETTTPGEPLDFFLTYYENSSRKSVKLFSAIVPNTATQSLSNITTVTDLDFG